MSERILTSQEMKAVEKIADESGLSYLRLMENAGSAAATIIRKRYHLHRQNRCLILCGNGNNGGDGFVVARKFIENDIPCQIALIDGLPKTNEAKEMFRRIQGCDLEFFDFQTSAEKVLGAVKNSDVIIDAIYGTGFRGDLREDVTLLAQKINQEKKKVFALDIPSGISADSADVPKEYIHPQATIVFAAYKPAHRLEPTSLLCGEILLADIGIDKTCFEQITPTHQVLYQDYIQQQILPRDPRGHKGTFGKLMNVSGSFGMAGAAMMSTLSALRSGVGLVTLATGKRLAELLTPAMLENTILPLCDTPEGTISTDSTYDLIHQTESCSAALIGCGLSCCDNTRELVEKFITSVRCPIVVDADGINCISANIDKLQQVNTTLILTPHIGEFARLIGMTPAEIKQRRYTLAKQFAEQYNVVLVLKDYVTLIACPDGRVFIHENTNSGLAKGGSGDVLAGLIASLCAQGYQPEMAAACGVWIHAQAARRCADRLSCHSMIARDLIEELPMVFTTLQCNE